MGPSIDSIDRAIKQAGAKRGWRMMTKKPGHISAVIVVRQHKAEVDILFDRQKFSIKYRDSMNLNYNASRNTIHRSYNTWVTNLRNDIQNTVALTPEDSGNQPKSAGQ